MTLASAFLVASCVGSGETINSRGLTAASAGDSDAEAAETVTQGDALQPTTNPFPTTEGSNAPDSTAVETTAAPGSAAGLLPVRGTPPGGRRVSLRPKNNVNADDLLDHWGHRRNELLSEQLSQASEPNDDVADFEDLLEAVRKKGTEPFAPDLRDDDTVTVLGHRRGVTYGRWSGGPADTLSIKFDYQNKTISAKDDRSFKAALERAGKAWSVRIDDTWQAWERKWRESQGPADRKLRQRGEGNFCRAGGGDQHRPCHLRDRGRSEWRHRRTGRSP